MMFRSIAKSGMKRKPNIQSGKSCSVIVELLKLVVAQVYVKRGLLLRENNNTSTLHWVHKEPSLFLLKLLKSHIDISDT